MQMHRRAKLEGKVAKQRRDSPAPEASGCLSAKCEPRRGRKGPSRPQGPARVRDDDRTTVAIASRLTFGSVDTGRCSSRPR